MVYINPDTGSQHVEITLPYGSAGSGYGCQAEDLGQNQGVLAAADLYLLDGTTGTSGPYTELFRIPAKAPAAGKLSVSPLPKTTCLPTTTGSETVVDLDSHRSFARLRTVCIGTLHRTGVIEAGALFVLQDVGPAQDARTEIVRVDLRTYAVTRSTSMAGAFSMFTGFGDIWVSTASTNVILDQLSPMTLRVLHRFAEPDCARDFVPLAGRLWFIDNCSLETLNPYSLETLNPTDGRTSAVRLPWLPAGLSTSSITSSGGELYLLASSPKSPETAIATYNPVTGAHRFVPQLAGGSELLSVTGTVLWVGSQCFMSCSVTAYSSKSLRPLTGGFGGGGVDGLWVAVPDAGDLWFQFVGEPLECVSGKTGRFDASLRLPNTYSGGDNLAVLTPPGFVAADTTNLIIAANETHGANPSESGIAVYPLDPRCSREIPLEARRRSASRLDVAESLSEAHRSDLAASLAWAVERVSLK